MKPNDRLRETADGRGSSTGRRNAQASRNFLSKSLSRLGIAATSFGRQAAPLGVLPELAQLGLGVLAAVDGRDTGIDGGALHAQSLARKTRQDFTPLEITIM